MEEQENYHIGYCLVIRISGQMPGAVSKAWTLKSEWVCRAYPFAADSCYHPFSRTVPGSVPVRPKPGGSSVAASHTR